MRRLWLIIYLFIFISHSIADDPLTCSSTSGQAAPSITFSDQHDANLNASLFIEQIVAYLNATNTTEGLQAAIEASLVQNTEIVPYLTAQVLEVDVTNDQVVDILTSINMAYGVRYENYLTLFMCVDNTYVPLDTVINEDWSNWLVAEEAPGTIELIIDVNGNAVPEIILRERTLTGQKYAEKLTFYEWQTNHLAATFTLSPNYGGFGALSITNRDADPTTAEIIIEDEYGYGQAIALAFNEVTHYRAVEMVYQWDGTAYQKICQIFAEAPITLFETLQSAETRRACHEYVSAAWYYSQLWEYSQRLQAGVNPPDNPVTPQDAELERAYLRAFAGYRLVQYAVQQGKTDPIDPILATLQTDYPVGSHGYAYAVMASTYWETYQTTQQAAAACAAAKTTFETARSSGDDPGIVYQDATLADGTILHFGFYKPGIFHLASDPDNLFDVPEEIADMVQIPVCFE